MIMCLRSRSAHPRSIISLGLFFIALANVTQYVLQRHSAVSESVADGVGGFFFGIAIATTCFGIFLHGRAARSSADS